MEGERKVNPNCVNAGNPFHQCADYCGQRSSQNPRLKIGGGGGGGKSPVRNGNGIKVEGRSVDPSCVNASNPFHQCADYCVKKTADVKKQGSGRFAFPALLKLSPRSPSDRSDGGKSVPSTGSLGLEGRNVNPNCVNASNPFHQCAEYCTKKTMDAKKQHAMRKTVQNGELGKAEARKTDPMCVNASNPFHQCTELCSHSAPRATRQTNGYTLGALIARESEEEASSRGSIREEEPVTSGALIARENEVATSMQDNINEEEPAMAGALVGREIEEGTLSQENIDEEEVIRENIKGGEIVRESVKEEEAIRENLKIGESIRENRREAVLIKERNKVDPRCPNASNPFHECADYCLQKISGSSLIESGKSDRGSRRKDILTVRKGVDPRCVNASNPFHQCAEYCFQRIREAT